MSTKRIKAEGAAAQDQLQENPDTQEKQEQPITPPQGDAPSHDTQDTPQEPQEESKPVEPQETKYDRNELIEDSFAIFGYYPEVVAGALYGDDRSTYTVAEVKQLIGTFMKRKVE